MTRKVDTMAAWGMALAKAKLSEVVHEAEIAGPQTLMRSGRQVAVVVSMQEWQKLNGTACGAPEGESIADFFMRSPLWKSGLKLERLKWKPRKIDL